MNWPVKVSRRDEIAGTGVEMDSTVFLYPDGRLVCNTHTWEDTLLRGGHGGVVVLGYDASSPPMWLYASAPHRYGVEGKAVGASDRTDTFTEQLDKDTMGGLSYVAVKHYNAPNNAAQDIQAWLDGAKHDFDDVAGIATDIGKIFAAV